MEMYIGNYLPPSYLFSSGGNETVLPYYFSYYCKSSNPASRSSSFISGPPSIILIKLFILYMLIKLSNYT